MNRTDQYADDNANERGVALCRVTYRMTDQMGVVYHGNYLEMFEMGRVELFRSAGLRYAEMEAAGYRLPVVHAACDYLRPARYDDLLEIRANIAELSRARLHFDYAIRRRGETDLLAHGKTRHVFLSPEGRIRRVDDAWFEKLREAAALFDGTRE